MSVLGESTRREAPAVSSKIARSADPGDTPPDQDTELLQKLVLWLDLVISVAEAWPGTAVSSAVRAMPGATLSASSPNGPEARFVSFGLPSRSAARTAARRSPNRARLNATFVFIAVCPCSLHAIQLRHVRPSTRFPLGPGHESTLVMAMNLFPDPGLTGPYRAFLF